MKIAFKVLSFLFVIFRDLLFIPMLVLSVNTFKCVRSDNVSGALTIKIGGE
jgi:hypothetical protein